MKYGYARVSTAEQNLDLQINALENNGVDRIFSEKISGKNGHKPILSGLIAKLKLGDQLIVWKLDRLGRKTSELIKLQESLEKKGISLVSLTEDLDTSSPYGKFVFQLLCSIAEMERNIISERTLAGLSSAKANGRFGGRRPGLTKQAQKKAKFAAEEYRRYKGRKDLTINDICMRVGVARATLYKYLRIEGVGITKGKNAR